MKYSYSWLSEHLEFDEDFKSLEFLVPFLNLKGLEVESGSSSEVLDITPAVNRPDLLSHIGLARELSCLLGSSIKLDDLFWPSTYKKEVFRLGMLNNKKSFSSRKSHHPALSKRYLPFKVLVEEPEICPLYCGQMITGVKIKESPEELKTRLKSLGHGSVNNVVDAANWVLQEWGQPLHAFDADQIEGPIRIEKARAKEKFTALDSKTIELCGDELMIRDDKKNLALAGIIGGQSSSVTEKTQNIFLESAVFAPYAVRRAARRFHFETDSALRFSRGVFPQTTKLALKRASSLIQQLAGGEILTEDVEIGKSFSFAPKKAILISKKNLEERLGRALSFSELISWMKKMNIAARRKGFGSKALMKPPYYRKDLNIKEDLIEEGARLKGYEGIEAQLPEIRPPALKADPFISFCWKAKQAAKEQGFYQAIHYSFSDAKWSREFLGDKTFKGRDWAENILVTKPISEDLNALRLSLLPGLFQNALFNIRRGQDVGRIFEQGVVFEKEGFKENEHLAFLLWGRMKSLFQKNEFSVFFDLKSAVSSVSKRLSIPDFEYQPLPEEELSFFHPKRKLALHAGGGAVGSIGILHPALLESAKAPPDIAMGWMDLSLLFQSPRQPFRFQNLSPLPQVKRDISVVAGPHQTAGALMKALKESAPETLKDIRLIDSFEGGGLEKGTRSLTFRITFQPMDETLSEDEIRSYEQNMIETLKKCCVELRK